MQECTVTYHAFDGSTFKSEKECIEHNNLPRIYVVYSSYGLYKRVIDIYVSEQDAVNFCNKIDRDYEVEPTVINLPNHKPHSVQTSLTNTSTKKHWWDIFKKG